MFKVNISSNQHLISVNVIPSLSHGNHKGIFTFIGMSHSQNGTLTNTLPWQAEVSTIYGTKTVVVVIYFGFPFLYC